MSEEEVSAIKKLVLSEYSNNDAKYFDSLQNSWFERFVKHDLEQIPMYFDAVYKGLLIKYFYCPDNHFSFNIVKGSNDKLYYVGMSDIYYFERGIKSEYTFTDENSVFKDANLQEIKGPESTVSYLNKIIKEEAIFKEVPESFPQKSRNFHKSRQIREFTLRLYQRYVPSFPPQPLFEEYVLAHEIEDYFLRLKPETATLSDKENELLDQYRKLQMGYKDEQASVFYLKNIGLVSLKVNQTTGLISETFIPQPIREKYW